MPPKPTKNEALQGQSLLVRTVAAALDIRLPSDVEKKFLGSLLRRAAIDIPTMPPGLLIRFFESATAVEFPEREVIDFRVVCERALAEHLGLAAHKAPAAAK